MGSGGGCSGWPLLLGLVVVVAVALVAGILLVGIFAFDAPLGDTVLVGVVLGLLLVSATRGSGSGSGRSPCRR